MKTKIILLLLLATVLTSEADTNSVFSASYQAYEEGIDSLRTTLEAWANSALLPKTDRKEWEENAYAIYEDIWNPTNLVRLGDFAWIKTLEEKFWTSDFFLIPDQLPVHVANSKQDFESVLDLRSWILNGDEILEKFQTHVITNFHPNVTLMRGKVIPLTSTRESVLREFLGQHQVFGPKDRVSEKDQASSEKRANFLKTFIPIHAGHWSGWDLTTDPTVSSIIFSFDQTDAVVSFSLGWSGGRAIYKKVDGKWTLIKSSKTWTM